jgi:hypothetical protein
MQLSRRKLLTGAILGTSGCVDTATEPVDDSVGAGTEPSQGPEKEFGGQFGLERAGWNEENLFEIEVAQDHDTDGFGIRYESKSKPEDDVHFFLPPDYGGVVEIDLLKQFESGESTPPDGEYHIYAYKGTDAIIVFDVEEVLGHVAFEIAPQLAVTSTSVSDSGELDMKIENGGNAPIRLSALSYADRSVSVETTIPHGATETIHIAEPPFEEEDDCVLIPPSLEFDLKTVPKIGATALVNTGRDDTERLCTVQM